MDQNLNLTVSEAKKHGAAAKKKALIRTLISLVALIVVTVILFSAQTLAWFSDSVNSSGAALQAGTLNIDLIEMADKDTAYTTEPVAVMPATSVSKIVTVANRGSLDAYVRIKLDLEITKTAGHENEESQIPTDWKKYVEIHFNDATLWFYNESDGYYYYMKPLAPEKETEHLFDTVVFAAAMGNEFTNTVISFVVTAEATQTFDNGDTPLQAEGWPDTNNSNANTTQP